MVAKYHLVLLLTATIFFITLETAAATCTVVNSAVTDGFEDFGAHLDY